jgi:molybdate transport system substrate-binding protein
MDRPKRIEIMDRAKISPPVFDSSPNCCRWKGSRCIAGATWSDLFHRRRNRIGICFAILCAVLLASCNSAKMNRDQIRVNVLVAASAASSIETISQMFETANPGVDVRVVSGPSNGLAQQILAGAPADIFLSASAQWADSVSAEGLTSEAVDLLTNRLVLIVPIDNPVRIQQPADLTNEAVKRIAIAGENVPAGIYGEQVLRNLGLLETLQREKKLVRGSDVRATLAYVERAEADVGIVYASDARNSDRVKKVFEFDPQHHDRIVYRVVLIESSENKVGARPFFEFLKSSAARDVFESFGFQRIPLPN